MRIKSSTRFTIFSTLTMTAGNFIFFLFIVASFWEHVDETLDTFTWPILSAITIMTAGTAFVSYFVSSLVVDRILNPVRSMINKVKAIGERRFSAARLVLDSGEDELVDYASAFNEMTLKIGGYIEKQKRFVSDASHELATPITIINGHADMLLRWGKDDPAVLLDGLEIIKNEALRMNELVEKLLFFARSDSQRQEYNFAKEDIGLLLASCVEEARKLYPESNIIYNDPSLSMRNCDANALRRVFRILFDNAVKHGGKNKSIIVNAEEKTGGQVQIRLADKGPGIPPEHLERVFDRFFRADESRAKKTGGSGLGLAIAKEIIERHNGSIRVENDGGAVFIIEM